MDIRICEACKGTGVILANNDKYGLRIEKCDACDKFISDEEAQSQDITFLVDFRYKNGNSAKQDFGLLPLCFEGFGASYPLMEIVKENITDYLKACGIEHSHNSIKVTNLKIEWVDQQ